MMLNCWFGSAADLQVEVPVLPAERIVWRWYQ